MRRWTRRSIVATVCCGALGAVWAGDPSLCTWYVEDMESGAPGWTSFVPARAKVGDPPGPSSWHVDDATCREDALDGNWFVSNGNDGPGCDPDSTREHSVLLGPVMDLPDVGPILLDFDALSFDEAGTCLASATFDQHEVGVSLDDGTTWTSLNDCSALTDGTGKAIHHTFDLTAWAGQSVRVVFAYDTRDDSTGHTFAVDNVIVSTESCQIVCGDSLVGPGEACDDGNDQLGDGCRPDCTQELCSDGIVDPQEACDDGNGTLGDGCRYDCTLEVCGDGIVDPGEVCDDGNSSDVDLCNTQCEQTGVPVCTVYFEDMEGTAQGWSSFVPPQSKIGDPPGPSTWHLDDQTCRGDALGGRWFVSNGNDGPGCMPDSARERSVLVSPEVALPTGDAVVLDFDALSFDEAGTCLAGATFDKHDVGVSVDGGASWTPLNDCTSLADGSGAPIHHSLDLGPWVGQTIRIVFAYETRDDSTGHTFAVDNVTVRATGCSDPCGNDILDAGEACDDGNGEVGDGCRPNCTAELCGDGLEDPDEECDDGNVTSNDGCTGDCRIESCGDGLTQTGEECDDANQQSGDGCRPDCTAERCGDGLLDAGELCDDGNETGGDGCRFDCTIERCGDGIEDPGEECDDANFVDTDGCTTECVLCAVCAFGLAEATLDHGWTRVGIAGVPDPVVIAGPPTSRGPDRGVVQLRNVTSVGFDVRFKEWDYLNRIHRSAEHTTFMLLSPGRLDRDDGSIWETGRFRLSGTAAASAVTFGTPFPGKPLVLLTVQTAHGTQPVAVRVSDTTSAGFTAALYEEEELMNDHVEETVGYVAIYCDNGWGEVESGDGRLPYLLQRAAVDHRWSPLLGWRIRVEEETSADPDLTHVPESIDALALGGHLFAQVVSTNESDTVVLARNAPDASGPIHWGLIRDLTHTRLRIPLPREYDDPVVVVAPISLEDPEPAIARVSNLRTDRFDVRLQNWDAPQHPHGAESAFYIVVEAGSHVVNETTINAGFVRIRGRIGFADWTLVPFPVSHASTPAMFAAVQTLGDSSPVVTRLMGAGPDSFQITLREKEASSGSHPDEILGWISIDKGSGSSPLGRTFSVFDATRDGTLGDELLADTPLGTKPTVVIDAQTARGSDPFFPRFLRVGSTRVFFLLQEETSFDEETDHLPEELAVFVGE